MQNLYHFSEMGWRCSRVIVQMYKRWLKVDNSEALRFFEKLEDFHRQTLMDFEKYQNSNDGLIAHPDEGFPFVDKEAELGKLEKERFLVEVEKRRPSD